MKETTGTRVFKAVMVLLTTLLLGGLELPDSHAAEPIRIRFAHQARPDVSMGQRIQAFVDRVDGMSKGRVTVENHHSGKLVMETAAARAVMQGNIEDGFVRLRKPCTNHSGIWIP